MGNKEGHNAFCKKIFIDTGTLSIKFDYIGEYAYMVKSCTSCCLLVRYEIKFAILIWLEIYERIFGGTTTLPFLWLNHYLFDTSIVPTILDIECRIEVTRMSNVWIINDLANLIYAQRAQWSWTMIFAYFEIPSTWTKVINNPDIFDVKIGYQIFKPKIPTLWERGSDMSICVLTSTFELVGASIPQPDPTVTGTIRVSK